MKTVQQNQRTSLAGGLAGLRVKRLAALRAFKCLLKFISENLDFRLASRTYNLHFFQLFIAFKSWTMLICHGVPPSIFD